MQKHHGSTVVILGLVAAVAIGTLHFLQTQYPHEETKVTVERHGLADVEAVFGEKAKAPAPARKDASAGSSDISAAEQSAAATLQGVEEDPDNYDYGNEGGDYSIEDGPYAEYAQADSGSGQADDEAGDSDDGSDSYRYDEDADPYDGSVAEDPYDYGGSSSSRYDEDADQGDSASESDDADEQQSAAAPARSEPAQPAAKPAAKPESKPEPKPIQRAANPDARDYGYDNSTASSGSSAGSNSRSSSTASSSASSTASAAPKKTHVEPIPKPKGETPPAADTVYQWWPDARRVPGGQFTLIYAGQPKNKQSVALLFSRTPELSVASQHIRVLDADGEPVTGSWVTAANPRMIQLGGLKRGRYTVIVNASMRDSTGRTMARTLSGPVYIN